jgi:hypothetical protein
MSYILWLNVLNVFALSSFQWWQEERLIIKGQQVSHSSTQLVNGKIRQRWHKKIAALSAILLLYCAS